MAVIAEREIAAGTRAERAGWGATDALLLLMSVIWGANFSIVKFATGRVAPLAFNGVRVALAAAALLALVAVDGGLRVQRRDALRLLALGVLGNGVYQILFIEGVARTRAGNAALVLAATPAFIALIGRLLRVERVSRRGWMGITLSLCGIALVTFGRSGGPGVSAALIGNLLVLGGALCWATFTVLLKPLAHRVDALRVGALTMLGGALPLILFASPSLVSTDWTAVPLSVWGAVVYSAIGALVIAYLIWYRGVRVLGPTRTAMYSNLQPATALLVAWALLGEVPTPWQVAGIATVVAGVLLTRA
jgi:drug/metabolite transporter (DMT)-like permease